MSVSPHRMSRRAHPLLVPGRDRTSVECANQDLMKPKLVITFTMQKQHAWYRPKSSAPRENVWDKQSGIWEGSFAQWKRLWSPWNNFSILHHFLALLLTSWNVTEIMLANSLVSLHCDGQIHAIWHHSSMVPNTTATPLLGIPCGVLLPTFLCHCGKWYVTLSKRLIRNLSWWGLHWKIL